MFGSEQAQNYRGNQSIPTDPGNPALFPLEENTNLPYTQAGSLSDSGVVPEARLYLRF